MGNKISPCYQNGSCVKVYHGDNGQLLQFSGPTPAIKLLRDHPDCLLIYSVVKTRRAPTSEKAVKGEAPLRHVHVRVVRPGDLLYATHVYFLVHIPDQYRAKLAKYFDLSQIRPASPASPRWRSNSPSASPLAFPPSPFYVSPTRSPQASRNSTESPVAFWSATSSPLSSPLRSPLRSPLSSSDRRAPSGSTKERTKVDSPLPSYTRSPKQMTRAATPRSTYARSPLSGSTREMARVGNMQAHSQRNSGELRGNQSPRALRMPRKEITLGSILNQDLKQAQNVSTLGEIFNQESTLRPDPQPNPNGSMRSPGRTIAAMQDTLMSLLYQNLHQQNSANTFAGSPGRAIAPTPVTSTRDTQRPKGSSPHRSKNSPRRSVKLGPGKADLRHRRGGMRSPSHQKALLLKSPSRSSNGRVAVTKEGGSVPSMPEFEGRESTTGNNRRSDASGAPAPGGNTVTRRKGNGPRPTRTRPKRSASWTPGLGSISENSVSESSDVEDLITSRYHRLVPPHPAYFRRRVR